MADLRLNGRLKTSKVTVTPDRNLLPTTPLNSQTSRTVYNKGSVIVFLGDQNVTASGDNEGIPLDPGKERTFGCSEKFLLYGITASSNADVIVGEAY